MGRLYNWEPFTEGEGCAHTCGVLWLWLLAFCSSSPRPAFFSTLLSNVFISRLPSPTSGFLPSEIKEENEKKEGR